MEKIKLQNMEAAMLSDMWRTMLRQRQRETGLGRDNGIPRAMTKEARKLIEKFSKAFELPDEAIVQDWDGFIRALSVLENVEGKTKKREKWLVNGDKMPTSTAIHIFEMHIKDMMDIGYYDKFTEDERSEYIGLFGGTFAHERGEMLSEVLDVIKKALTEKDNGGNSSE